MALQVLHRGAHSDAIRALQAATNRRLHARDLDALKVKEDGVLGARTLEAVRKAAWALGALKTTYDALTTSGEVPVGVQAMIRNPGRREDAQIARAKVRMSQMRAQRAGRACAAVRERAEHGTSSRTLAVNAFLAKVGTRESPPGSNSGGIITMMESYWGFGAVPWCGISFGYHAQVFGGVKGLRSDVASVAAIEQHARRGDEPYGRWVARERIDSLLPGSALVIGGSGIHLAMKVANWRDGAETVEGNTSFGMTGSQSNGGCIAHRFRTGAEIYGGAAMNYPG